jgi:hypothetical protein
MSQTQSLTKRKLSEKTVEALKEAVIALNRAQHDLPHDSPKILKKSEGSIKFNT